MSAWYGRLSAAGKAAVALAAIIALIVGYSIFNSSKPSGAVCPLSQAALASIVVAAHDNPRAEVAALVAAGVDTTYCKEAINNING
jgi:hypothetical protein